MSKKNTRTHMLTNPKQLPQNICKHFNPSDHVTTGDSPPPVLTVLSKHAVRLSVQTPTMHYSTGFGQVTLHIPTYSMQSYLQQCLNMAVRALHAVFRCFWFCISFLIATQRNTIFKGMRKKKIKRQQERLSQQPKTQRGNLTEQDSGKHTAR